LFGDVLTKLNTIWMQTTYPFGRFGRHVSIHYSCDIRRSISNRVQIGDSVYLAPDNWLNIPELSSDPTPVLIIGDGCKIGRRCMLSAKNRVCLEENVLLGPGVLITDHSHEFSDVNSPILAQGITAGGTVRIERNCWIGFGAAIVCTTGELVIGRNSVVGTNAVVTRSIPPFCVVAGNPAKIVRRYDSVSGQWVKEKQS
jgi:abequosyltransferase